MPPPPKPPPPHRLEVTKNSLRNTAIAVDDDSMHYEIVTRFWHPHLTKINRADFENLAVETVAEIERLPGREPRVRFGGDKGEWIPVSQFIQFDEDKAYVVLFLRVTLPLKSGSLAVAVHSRPHQRLAVAGGRTRDSCRYVLSIRYVSTSSKYDLPVGES